MITVILLLRFAKTTLQQIIPLKIRIAGYDGVFFLKIVAYCIIREKFFQRKETIYESSPIQRRSLEFIMPLYTK